MSEFAKKTGDYASLSATDIKVMALTLLLEQENGGLDHIHTEPTKSRVRGIMDFKLEINLIKFFVFQTFLHSASPSMAAEVVRQPSNTPGFFLPKETEKSEKSVQSSRKNSESTTVDPINEINRRLAALDTEPEPEVTPYSDPDDWSSSDEEADDNIGEPIGLSDDIKGYDAVEETASSGDKVEEEDDDEVGWITPQNIKSAYRKMGMEKEVPSRDCKVACLSTDFSVQVSEQKLRISCWKKL